MNQQQLEETILQALATIVPGADLQSLNPKISFHDQLEIDSIDFLRFMAELERVLAVAIPDLDYPKLSTLQGCIAYLSGQLVAVEDEKAVA